MSTACPYCNSARSILFGNVYCSVHSTPMESLDTGTLFIKAKKLEETAEHVSRLSIRCMLNGEQRYNVGGSDRLVNADNFLVINQGQRYKTGFQSTGNDSEMLMVGFRPGFAESLLHSLVTPDDKLLDNPNGTYHQPVLFFEKTYPADAVIAKHFRRLRQLMDKDFAERSEADLDSVYTALLTRLLKLHRYSGKEMSRLGASRKSTRVELYKRLWQARDFMDAHVADKLRLDDIALVACLSVHHFKRAFKDLFGISPHQYLIERRIGKAQLLLQRGLYRVDEVCVMTGFENTSSFVRLFRQRTGVTPGQYAAMKTSTIRTSDHVHSK